MSQTGSLHGLGWFNYFTHDLLKALVLGLVLICICCVLPAFLWVKLNEFLREDSILTKVATTKLEEIEFPKLTVCNPFYFIEGMLAGTS